MQLTENELEGLLSRARLMDTQALGQIHDLYYPQIYRYIYFQLDDEQASQQIADIALQGLIDVFHKGVSSKGKLDGWLLKASDKQVQYYQRQSGIPGAIESTQAGAESLETTDSNNPQKETSWGRRLVHLALRQLDPEQQRFLALRYAQERSPEDIATLTGRNLAEVKALQFRALQSLRRFLEVEG